MRGGVGQRKPEISIVVVVHDMAREAPRTLHSLSAVYQRHIAADEYEVIVVDNGSMPPLDRKLVDDLAGNFRLIRLDPAPRSPAHAINVGLTAASADIIGVMIDGARMVTPGLLHFAWKGALLYPRPVVATLGWYLGFDHQRWSIADGYDTIREDALLESIDWQNSGYRLFEISALDGSSIDGCFAPIAESNALFLRREVWDELGGADERFDAPGGGFLNLDIFRRAVGLPGSELIILLGEGTFHQAHGGVATNSDFKSFSAAIDSWRDQYQALRGHGWAPPQTQERTYIGVLPRAALAHLVRSVVEPARAAWYGTPLGDSFDQSLWTLEPTPRPVDATVAALVELAETEFRARRFEASATVARRARRHAPDEPSPQRLLAHASAWLAGDRPDGNCSARFHLARAKADRLLGDVLSATSEYHAALNFDADLVEAHVGLSELRMPGDGYISWLARLHTALLPDTYLEIGIARGQSLACAHPPTRAIGVDPQPMINSALTAETHIFCETSDVFFGLRRLDSLLEGRALGLAFIDGLHVFEQSLKDFMNVEAFCAPQSVVLLHDTVPLDEPTQRPDRQRKFYTGDVWKTVLCLKHYRPDLEIFTIATPWTGLTVVLGLDAASNVLRTRYDEAVARFIEMPYSELESREQSMLNIVPNEWAIMEARLMARGITCRPG